MPRAMDWGLEEDPPGHLTVETRASGYVEVFYSLSAERLELWKSWFNDETGLRSAVPDRVKLLEINGRMRQLTMIPTKTRVTSPDLLTAKYGQVKRITTACGDSTLMQTLPSTQDEVMMLLEDLPSCFVKDYDYGLGLTRSTRCIVDAVELLSDCTEICISEDHITGTEDNLDIFYISKDDFESVLKSINRTVNIGRIAARSVKQGATYNFFATKLGKPHKFISTGRSPLRRQITDLALGRKESLSGDEQDAILDLVSQNAESIAETRSRRLASLQRDIELVTLDNLIERYDAMIKRRLHESAWQNFLDENPFVLTLAFGYPIIKVHEQAYVGGRKIIGGGGKIADFLVKNRMTSNVAIIEIKKPQTKLLSRQQPVSGVYTPSAELSGAINQALDQKHRFEQGIAQIKADSRIYDMEAYAVHCCLVIGQMPCDEHEQRSFEVFRGNSKDVEIITFDELLEKLKHLRDFLKSPDPEMVRPVQSSDLPF